MTNKFVRPDIAEMEPYIPIVPFEVLSARLGRAPEEIVKLDANENPYGPSPKALDALRNGRFFHIYPDPESNQLRDALSNYVQMPKERLLTGMGADELIDLVLRVVLSPGDVVIDCPPSFGMYPFSTAVNSGQYVPVWRKEDFSLDVEGIETAVAQNPTAKILFLCSPNNPDGSTISDADLRRLLQLPVLVVLDEAYADFDLVNRKEREERKDNKEENFAPSASFAVKNASRIHWTLEYDNLAVLRTFSKLAGLAGLRVGYGAFPDWLLPHLWKIKQPYNINVAASLAALASLEDRAWLQEKVQLLVAERERLFTELGTIGYLNPFPSRSNFILCRVIDRDARQLKLDLEQAGILVRYFNKPGLDNCIRISAGRPEETDRLIAELHRLGEQ
ncbi:MAG: histidinol-phosphate transaminase [Ardenticatenaceae bacterium]|nr:histidinol-phosphate transaminase [Ardenticatenaceae bacterium]MCB8949497.1 histidinol-phosphate transaminase [Ardenticatenaceae bacterium]